MLTQSRAQSEQRKTTLHFCEELLFKAQERVSRAEMDALQAEVVSVARGVSSSLHWMQFI